VADVVDDDVVVVEELTIEEDSVGIEADAAAAAAEDAVDEDGGRIVSDVGGRSSPDNLDLLGN